MPNTTKKPKNSKRISEAILLYTDGSASYKQGNGAWAFVAVRGKAVFYDSGYDPSTKVNAMELTAILRALQFIPDKGTAPVRVFSDSQYSVNCINVWGPAWEKDGWVVKTGVSRPPKNLGLIRDILKRLAFLRKTRMVQVHWIAGHSNHQYNEMADKLAGEARRAGMAESGK